MSIQTGTSMAGTSVDLGYRLQDFGNSLYNIGQGAYGVVASLLIDVKQIAKSSDGIDAVFRFVSESVTLVDVIQRGEKVARPLLTAIGNTRACTAAFRIIYSIQYVASGECYRDWRDNKIPTLVAAGASAAARTWQTVSWFGKFNAISLERFGHVAAKVGSIPVLGLVSIQITKHFLSLAFLIEALALGKNSISDLYAGRNVAKNRIDLLSACSEATLCIVSIAGFTNPVPVALAGTFAAATSIAAFYFDPASTTSKQ